MPDGGDEWAFMSPTPGYPNSGLSISSNNSIPETYHLHQNYPNPFNPETTIQFSMETHSNVSLRIFDITGRLVESLINEPLFPGEHEITWHADLLSSGVYFVPK